ncbi:MAG: methylmalonyl Co-A mutase-associated GTPase MeaB, partial [Actinomycetota bacterium]|nr:methylmalonyl Co-A mutase-associated GTPase MeaB [Actinomycetota bacterium]
IEDHRALLEKTGLLDERRLQQQEKWLDSMIEEAVLTAIHARDGVNEAIAAARTGVAAGEITVPQATLRVIEAAGLE